MICLNKISKTFVNVKALDSVSMEIHPGEIHCLMGENGSGKSTLIKIISGVYQPDKGEIIIDDSKFNRLTPSQSIDKGIQIIYQDFSVFPNLTVAENIIIGKIIAMKKKIMYKKTLLCQAKIIASELGLDVDLEEKVENLSVANKQLVAICRALMNEARLLVLDEPTTALTQNEVKRLFRIIRQLQNKGVAILFVSHKLDEGFELAERFTILRNGKNVITTRTKELTKEKFIEYMTGRKIQQTRFSPDVDYKQIPLLEVHSICVQNTYKNISFNLYPGEIIGITGLLGSGRTELALSLFGAMKIESGEIFIKGKKVNLCSIEQAAKHNICYVPEDRLTEGLFLPQSINHNIAIGNLREFTKSFGMIDRKKMHDMSMFYVEQLSIINDGIHNAIMTLSGGNQQKTVVSRCLSQKPDILIINGPTVGVDIAAKYDLHNILRNLAQRGIGIIIISDDIPEVYSNCNRVFVMKKGLFISELKGMEISEEKLSMLMSSHEGVLA